MKVCLVHERYQHPGGEDLVFESERDLLERRGIRVVTYLAHNDAIPGIGRAKLAAGTLWNTQAKRELEQLLIRERPDVVHFHNTFPLISPATYYAARRAGVPIVQTLHNFRLICPSATLFRDGRPCEACVGRVFAWPGILHACYRGSRSASAVTAGMLTVHRALGTWRGLVDVYLPCSEFARQKFIEGGMPAAKLVVKPNCLPSDPGVGAHEGGYALYVGRLVPEKGVERMLQAWRLLDPPLPLRIIGGGPLETLSAQHSPAVEWLGWQPREAVLRAMKEAAFLVFPSEWYEGLPMTVLEALAVGLPVVTPGLGGVAELVRHEHSGLHYRTGDTAALAAAVDWLGSRPERLREMGLVARRTYEERFSAEHNYHMLMEIYERVRKPGLAALPDPRVQAAEC
jgi:glycosyltransferase involved in cell wall biosynthesis